MTAPTGKGGRSWCGLQAPLGADSKPGPTLLARMTPGQFSNFSGPQSLPSRVEETNVYPQGSRVCACEVPAYSNCRHSYFCSFVFNWSGVVRICEGREGGGKSWPLNTVYSPRSQRSCYQRNLSSRKISDPMCTLDASLPGG